MVPPCDRPLETLLDTHRPLDDKVATDVMLSPFFHDVRLTAPAGHQEFRFLLRKRSKGGESDNLLLRPLPPVLYGLRLEEDYHRPLQFSRDPDLNRLSSDPGTTGPSAPGATAPVDRSDTRDDVVLLMQMKSDDVLDSGVHDGHDPRTPVKMRHLKDRRPSGVVSREKGDLARGPRGPPPVRFR